MLFCGEMGGAMAWILPTDIFNNIGNEENEGARQSTVNEIWQLLAPERTWIFVVSYVCFDYFRSKSLIRTKVDQFTKVFLFCRISLDNSALLAGKKLPSCWPIKISIHGTVLYLRIF